MIFKTLKICQKFEQQVRLRTTMMIPELLIQLDRVNCADSAFIIFELLYNCFKNMPHVFFCHFVVCSVFVYLCTCIFVFACLTYGNIICDILEQSSFQKYAICWVFLALRYVLYLCILYLYFCNCVFDT